MKSSIDTTKDDEGDYEELTRELNNLHDDDKNKNNNSNNNPPISVQRPNNKSDLEQQQQQADEHQSEAPPHSDSKNNDDVGDEDDNVSSSSKIGPDSRPLPPSQEQQEQEQQPTPNMIGGKYTQHEYQFVVYSGICLSFNAGYSNGACLSGLLTDLGIQQSVAGFTGSYTNSALFLGDGYIQDFGFQICMILSFILGSCVSGILTPNPTPHRIEPTYGPSFFLGGILMIIASVLAATPGDDHFFFYLVAATNGIQNGISSMYSANLIRSTHLTGTSTDIGLFIGQLISGNKQNLWKLRVLLCLTTAFWIGGLISFYATTHFTHFSLLFSAGLFLLIGAQLIYFLVHELHISVLAAITGTWLWQKVFDQIEDHLFDSLRQGQDITSSEYFLKSSHFANYFDNHFNKQACSIIDKDGVDEEDLAKGLKEAGIPMSKREIRVLIRRADKNKTGKMTKEDFIKIAKSSMRRRQKQNSRNSLSSFIKGEEEKKGPN